MRVTAARAHRHRIQQQATESAQLLRGERWAALEQFGDVILGAACAEVAAQFGDAARITAAGIAGSPRVL
jgi:hypothetical protein